MENKLRVVLFVSRNKDNKHLSNYTQRKKSFLSNKTVEELEETFMDFVNKGLNGEMSRMYLSVNPRDEKSIKRELMHELFDNNVDLVKMESKLAKERLSLLEKINLIKDDPNLNAKVGWEIRLI